MASRWLIGAFLVKKQKTQARNVILPGAPAALYQLVPLLYWQLGAQVSIDATHDLFFPHLRFAGSLVSESLSLFVST